MSTSGGVKVTRLHELLRDAKPLRYWSRYKVTQLLSPPPAGKLTVTEARFRLKQAKEAYERAEAYFQKQGLDQVHPDSKLAHYWDSIITNFAVKYIPNYRAEQESSNVEMSKDKGGT